MVRYFQVLQFQVVHFHVLHFHALQIGPSPSVRAFSAPPLASLKLFCWLRPTEYLKATTRELCDAPSVNLYEAQYKQLL